MFGNEYYTIFITVYECILSGFHTENHTLEFVLCLKFPLLIWSAAL